MQRGPVIAWYIAVGYHFQLATAVTATSPCTAQYGGFIYFIFSNVITKFDTSTNGVSMQQLSAGPSTNSLCVQQPQADSVIIGSIIPVNYFDTQARASASYISYTQTGGAPPLNSIPASPQAIFLNSTCLFTITPFNQTYGAFVYAFGSSTLTDSATITSYVVDGGDIDMTSLAHAGMTVIGGNLYLAGGYASNTIYTLNGLSLQAINTSGTLPTGAMSAATLNDTTTNKQSMAMISAADPSMWIYDPSNNLLQNSAAGPQNSSDLILASTGQQLLAYDPNWGKTQQYLPNTGLWTVLNETTPVVSITSPLPTPSCTPTGQMTQSNPVTGDTHQAAKIGGGIAGGLIALVLLAMMFWLCHRRRRRAIEPDHKYNAQIDDRTNESLEEGTIEAKPKLKRYNINAKMPSLRMLNTSAITALYPTVAKPACNNIYANPTAPEGTILFKRYELIQSIRLNSLADGTAFRVGRDIKRHGNLVILKFMIDHNEFHKDLSTTRFLRSNYVTASIDSFELPSSITQHQYISVWEYRPTLASLMNDGRLERDDQLMLRKSARSMCEAVNWIHSKGIVHLQLQPNSFVHERTDPTRWLITDFQHACALTQKDEDIREPIDWTFSLNVYSAPDMFMNEGKLEIPATAELDIWSLWCILVEIATGVPPFNSVMAARKQRLAVRPTDPAVQRLLKTVVDLIPTLASIHRRLINVL
ncbi:hypothetical protein NQZ79_g6920 [Umbelopsis isabellina]|nr:hypothetical protein NQZ79_g6920 [Umbelopsis isabellina]